MTQARTHSLPAEESRTTARPRALSDSPAIEITDRMPPHDLAAEAGAIGSIILDPNCIPGVMSFLKSPQMFYREEHRIVFSVLRDLYDAGKPIDAMILHSALKTKNLLETIGGIDRIKELAHAVPTSMHAESYAATVLEKFMMRSIISGCTATLRDVYESGEHASEVLDRWHSRAFGVSDVKLTGVSAKLADILSEAFDYMDKTGGVGDPGLPTGLLELDNITQLYNGHLMVIGARPSMGKTAKMMGFVEHVGVNMKKPVGVVSLEMTKRQLSIRMLCSRSGISRKRLSSGQLTDDERLRLSHTTADLTNSPIYVEDSPGQSILDIRTQARRMKQQRGIVLLVVDYLQLIECGGGENRQQQISAISRGLKNIARELDIPVVVGSQLNRNSETQERLPRSSDLRESGAIEQDADEILLLHREAVAHRGDQEWIDANPDKLSEAIVVVAKQRDGECGIVKLTFLSEITRFVSYRPGA